MEEIKILDTKYSNYSSINNDENDYVEPVFASILRFCGCCLGYMCLVCCCGCYPYKYVDKGSRGIIQEFGKVKRQVGDGIHYVNPITEKLTDVNMKIQVIDLERQNVMTSDKLSINIDSVVYYQIINADDALFKINDIKQSIIELSYTTLRNVIGVSTLETCLGQRGKIAQQIKEIVDENVNNWGAKIISIQIKDIIIPENITSSLSSTVIAEREAEAKIIIAKADVKAAELMREAADILSTPASMQIRSLEVIDRLAHSNNTKIIILPSDLNLQSNIKSNLMSREFFDI